MLRDLAAAALMTLAAGACLPAPLAAAADGDQLVVVQDGRLQCLISAQFGASGRPMAICGLSDGAPFGASPNSTGTSTPLNLAVMTGNAESYWAAGRCRRRRTGCSWGPDNLIRPTAGRSQTSPAGRGSPTTTAVMVCY